MGGLSLASWAVTAVVFLLSVNHIQSQHKPLFPLSYEDYLAFTLAAVSLFIAAGGGIGTHFCQTCLLGRVGQHRQCSNPLLGAHRRRGCFGTNLFDHPW